MEIIILELLDFLIPPVIAGLIGGLIGVCSNAKIEIYGWRLTILSSIAGVVFAGAVSEYTYYNYGSKHILIQCALGIATGVIGSSGLDAIKQIAPKWSLKLIEKAGNTVIDSIPSKTDLPSIDKEKKDVSK